MCFCNYPQSAFPLLSILLQSPSVGCFSDSEWQQPLAPWGCVTPSGPRTEQTPRAFTAPLVIALSILPAHPTDDKIIGLCLWCRRQLWWLLRIHASVEEQHTHKKRADLGWKREIQWQFPPEPSHLFITRKSILQERLREVGWGCSILAHPSTSHRTCTLQRSLLAPWHCQNLSLPRLLVSAHCQ